MRFWGAFRILCPRCAAAQEKWRPAQFALRSSVPPCAFPLAMRRANGYCYGMKKLHDETYKRLFSNKALVESLLRGYVREDFAADMDFATLENCKASSVTDDQRTRMDDCVWKVSWRGQACCLCICRRKQKAQPAVSPLRPMRQDHRHRGAP